MEGERGHGIVTKSAPLERRASRENDEILKGIINVKKVRKIWARLKWSHARNHGQP